MKAKDIIKCLLFTVISMLIIGIPIITGVSFALHWKWHIQAVFAFISITEVLGIGAMLVKLTE